MRKTTPKIMPMNSDITYRKAVCQDADDIHRVEEACFLMPWSKRSIRNDVCKNASALYVVAVCNHRIVGFCGVHYIFDEGHIVNVAVFQDYRGRGIGKALVKTMLSISPSYVDRFTLEVRVSNTAAIKIYESLGFKSVGVRPGYYGDNHEDALIMWLNSHASSL